MTADSGDGGSSRIRAQLRQEIQEYLEQERGVDAKSVADDTQLEALGLDSLALNELGFHLFTRYAVMLSDEDILDALTLGDVLDVLTAEIASES